jgi:nucleotide-binding universal stress UspA family protein
MSDLAPIPEGAMAEQGPRLIYVAIDDSPHSKRAVQWAVRNTSVIKGPDELHFIAVLPPPPLPVAPSAPMATAGILAAQSVEASRKRDEHEAIQTLARARELVTKMGVRRQFFFLITRWR